MLSVDRDKLWVELITSDSNYCHMFFIIVPSPSSQRSRVPSTSFCFEIILVRWTGNVRATHVDHGAVRGW